MTKEIVREFFSSYGIGEWRRLVHDPYHRLEFDTTMHFLKKHLPPTGLVLDAGGGPGRYTIEVAKMGYDVVLLDLTPKLLQIAKRQIKRTMVQGNVKQIIEGSIDDLSMFGDSTFDAVLCCGTLGHLLDVKQREKAIDELIRVAKKKAPIFISVMGRLATLRLGLVRFPEELEMENLYRHVADTGDYTGQYGFTPCHYYLPEELEASMKQRNVAIIGMVGLEGLATFHMCETNRLFNQSPKAWKNWQEIHFRTCTHPVVVGMSDHFMIICRKFQA